jgi:hypothetical protein
VFQTPVEGAPPRPSVSASSMSRAPAPRRATGNPKGPISSGYTTSITSMT